MKIKLFDVIRYHILYRRHAPRMMLEPARFAGRSVLLAGPARTLWDDLRDLPPDRFDLIVKMNNGLYMDLPATEGPTLRCDVLFHSLTDEAKPVTPTALDAAGVTCLVHRTTGKGRFPLTLKAQRDLGSASRDIRLVPPEHYKALSARLGGASPTTGLVCLDFLLGCEISHLAIAGFTFFQTKYTAGYDDRDRADADSRARVLRAGHHDPASECALAAEMLAGAAAKGKTITLGAGVKASLENLAPSP